MKPRYVVRSDASFLPAGESRRVGATAIDVYERETTDRDSGLLDAMGRPLYRVAERRPIGLVHFGSDE